MSRYTKNIPHLFSLLSLASFGTNLSIKVAPIRFLASESPPKPTVSDLLISNHSHLSIQIYLSLQPSNTIASLCLVDYPRALDPLFDYPDHQRLCRSRLRTSILLVVFHIRPAVYSSNSIYIFPSFRFYPRIHSTSSNSALHLDLSS